MSLLSWLASLLLPAAATLSGIETDAASAPRMFTPAEIRADLDQMLSLIDRTHPDLSFVTDRDELRREAETVRGGIDAPMDVREAWLALARLNPTFRDAHTGLRHPVTEFDAYRDAGGAVFPLPVAIDRQGRLRVATEGTPGEIIESINGRSGRAIVDALMPRMRGETPGLRRMVLAFNFPGYLWTLLGPQPAFEAELVAADGTRRHVRLEPDGATVATADPFSLRTVAPGITLMRVASFDPQLRDRFAAFLEEAFRTLERDRSRTLLIDIRDNPGGAHDVSDLLVARLTRRPVLPTSRITARITEANPDIAPDAEPGNVVDLPFTEAIQPHASPFDGRVFLLVSENSYSQAIVFAATIRDNGLGQLVGEVTSGAANQTGQISLASLDRTGLQTLAPLYILHRPSGAGGRAGLQPDIPLVHDPADPDAMVEALLPRLRDVETPLPPRR